jgi:hypothetical protein
VAPLAIALSQRSILSNIDQARQRACASDAGVHWILIQSPVTDGRTVLRPPTVAVAIEPGTGRIIPVGDRVGETLWMTVTCATSDSFAPRVGLKTTPR